MVDELEPAHTQAKPRSPPAPVVTVAVASSVAVVAMDATWNAMVVLPIVENAMGT